jgi:predicted TIM-barrel fold metal-dependent hydrolase
LTSSQEGAADGPEVIDADLWVEQADYASLAPYLSRAWREYLNLGGVTNVAVNGERHGLPRSMFWSPGPAIAALTGQPDAPIEVAAYLDRHNIGAAVLNSGAALGVSSLANPRFAIEVARAANDWLRAEWLDRDERFRGSIVVPARDAELAAAEVRRLGDDHRFVQIQLAYPTARLGERQFDPLYEAASEHGLPVQLLAGAGYAGANRGVAGVGHPATRAEYEVDLGLACQPHVMSMLASRTLERHPSLHLVATGFGISWIPAFIWSAERALPSGGATSNFATHVRVTMSGASISERIGELLSLIPDAEEQLLYGSGDQRDEDVDPLAVADALPSAWRGGVMRGNAASVLLRPATVGS